MAAEWLLNGKAPGGGQRSLDHHLEGTCSPTSVLRRAHARAKNARFKSFLLGKLVPKAERQVGLWQIAPETNSTSRPSRLVEKSLPCGNARTAGSVGHVSVF
ncbi:hypothetical protein HC256_003158 [Beauveria bassiana]|nr:hypothetical protein HC256_003158 [Beauveria bassiana]